MAKPKIRFVCQACGYATAKWLGKCPECGQWDSFVEELETPERPGQSYLPVGETAKPKPVMIWLKLKRTFPVVRRWL